MATSTTAPNGNVNCNNNGSLSSGSRGVSSDPIAWLQSRIGSYDAAHDLEPLVQKSVLKGLKHVPKRSGRIKTELIDLGEPRSFIPTVSPSFSAISRSLPFHFSLPSFLTSSV